jgi:hypothetical protein
MTEEREPCGAEHPDHPDLLCERDPCSVYHRAGTVIWTQGAKPMPRHVADPVGVSRILKRTKAKARRTDPATSHEAAASLGHLAPAQELVRKALELGGPMTDEGIWAQLCSMPDNYISRSGARTRRSELWKMGRVMDSGLREYTEAGRLSIVWKLSGF